MILNIEQRIGNLIVSYIDQQGDVAYKQFTVPSTQQYSYVYPKQQSRGIPGLQSWDRKPVIKVPAQFLNKHRIQEFFMDAGEEATSEIFARNVPKMYCCDIEVDVTDEGFAEPADAKNRINSISWVRYPEALAFGLKPLSGEECKRIEDSINSHVKNFGKKYRFIYRQYNNEADMLSDFLYNHARHAPLITGWYFWGYDWEYIYNRCKLLNIDISWMSPTKQWYEHTIKVKNKKRKIMLPQHRLIVDYLSVYQKWDRTIEVKENDTLDFVSEAALGVRKVKYPGTLKDLFIKDYEQYIFYNVIDSILVELIDDKLKTMATFLNLGYLTRVEAIQAFSPIAMLEATLARYAYRRGQVFPKVFDRKYRQEYEGAFVFEPVPGLYDWVASFDFASLYPSIMRQFMISIENFVKKDIHHIPTATQIKTISGAVFDTSFDPLIPQILTQYYGQRKDAKSISLKAEMEMGELKRIKAERMKGTLK